MQKKISGNPKYTLGHRFVVFHTLEMAQVVSVPDREGKVRVCFTKYLPEQPAAERIILMSQENIQRLVNFKSIEFLSEDDYNGLAEAIEQMHLHVGSVLDNPAALLLKNRFVSLGFTSGINKAIEVLKNTDFKSRTEMIEFLKKSRI